MELREDILDHVKQIVDTPEFPEFMLWILSDEPFCTGIFKSRLKSTMGSIPSLTMVRTLYKEWLDTKIKPSEDKWKYVINDLTVNHKKFKNNEVIQRDIVLLASAAPMIDALNNVSCILNLIHSTWTHDKCKETQLEKLKDIISKSNEGLFTWEDYEQD